MGFDLLAAMLFAALLPLVILGFVAFWIMTSRDREHVAATWERYAARHALAFAPPEGGWPNRTSPVISWQDGEVEYRLEPLGREGHSRTRLTIRPSRAKLLGKLSVAARSHVSGGGSARGLEDSAFLAAYRVIEQPAGLARRVLTPEVRRALLAFRQGDSVTLGYRRGRALVEWPGGELNDARLDEARRLGDLVAVALVEAFLAPDAAQGQSRIASMK